MKRELKITRFFLTGKLETGSDFFFFSVCSVQFNLRPATVNQSAVSLFVSYFFTYASLCRSNHRHLRMCGLEGHKSPV